MESTPTPGFLRIAVALTDNISPEDAHKTVFIVPLVNINPDIPIVRKHETTVVVIVLVVRFESSLEIRPCFRVGGGSGFVLPCFHGDFASIIRTHPLVEFL